MDMNSLHNRRICRLCLIESANLISINESVSLKENRRESLESDNNINLTLFQHILEDLAFQKLEKELITLPLPPYVCQECFEATTDAYSFKRKCQNSLETFKNWIVSKDEVKAKMDNEKNVLFESSAQCSSKALIKCAAKKEITKENRFDGVKCPYCIYIIKYCQLSIEEFETENHSKFGYFNSNCCPFCCKIIQHSEEFSHHLNVVHKIYKQDLKHGHYFCDNTLFIYKLRGNDTRSELNRTQSTKSISSEDNKLINFQDKDEYQEIEKSKNNDQLAVSTSLNFKGNQSEILVKHCQEGKVSTLYQSETYTQSLEIQNNCNLKKEAKKFVTSNALECKLCLKTLSSRVYLQRHLEKHKNKRFLCKECHESFASRTELNTHTKERGHDKPLLCPDCGLRCRTSHILMIHLRRHTGEKPFKCSYCSKGFPRLYDLRVHEKYHTNEKSHFCETCGKGFQRKYNLNIHMRVHTGEKPYHCPQCPQAFAQSSDLKAHIRRHTGERYRCEICDATFVLGYQIRQHKLQEHGIKDVPPTQRLEKFLVADQKGSKEAEANTIVKRNK